MVFYFAFYLDHILPFTTTTTTKHRVNTPRLERSRQNGPKLFEEKPVESPETKRISGLGHQKTGQILVLTHRTDLPPQRVAFRKGNRLIIISGKSRLVKFYLFTQNGWFLTPQKGIAKRPEWEVLGWERKEKDFRNLFEIR